MRYFTIDVFIEKSKVHTGVNTMLCNKQTYLSIKKLILQKQTNWQVIFF